MARAARAMAMVTRVAGNEEGKGKGGEGDDDSNKEGNGNGDNTGDDDGIKGDEDLLFPPAKN
jgi:hypothetical protein